MKTLNKQAYMKDYRERNREYIRKQKNEWMAKLREEHPDITRERKRRDYEKHREKRLATCAEYRREYPETMERWRAENVEHVKQTRHDYNQRNPDRSRIDGENRRARIKKNGGQLSMEEWFSIVEKHDNKCVYCGDRGKLSMDHVVPIVAGGRHDISNVVPSCMPCNMSKGIRPVDEWLSGKEAARL